MFETSADDTQPGDSVTETIGDKRGVVAGAQFFSDVSTPGEG